MPLRPQTPQEGVSSYSENMSCAPAPCGAVAPGSRESAARASVKRGRGQPDSESLAHTGDSDVCGMEPGQEPRL